MYFLFEFLKICYLFIFRERGKEREKHQCVVACHMAPSRDLALGTWPTTQACALNGN